MARALFVFAVLVCAFAQESLPLDLSSCGLCKLFVSNLESYATTKVTKDDLLRYLNTASDNICGKIIPNSILSKEECVSYIQLYGPYTIDLIMANSDATDVCKQLSLCTSTLADGVNYELVYPLISDDQVVYTVKSQTAHTKGDKFFYRFFLGNPSFLDEEALTIRMQSSQNCNFQFEVVNKERNFDELVQCPAGTGMHCTSYVSQPGRGVWYYVTITAGDFVNATSAQFNLTALVENEIVIDGNFGDDVGVERYSHSIMPFFVPIILLVLCITCCCAIRKRKQKVQFKQQPLEQVHIDELPVGYFYAPEGYPMYVPMQMQPSPQPIFVMARPE